MPFHYGRSRFQCGLLILAVFAFALSQGSPVGATAREQQDQEERDAHERWARMHLEDPRPPVDDETLELMDRIRRDKFDQILPQVMRDRGIDMWIHVVREGDWDPLGYNLGSNEGVFIFTDRGGDRIERAVLGNSAPFIDEIDAYDIVVRPDFEIPLGAFPAGRMYLPDFYSRGGYEWPGGPKTELDFRFQGVGEFVAERDPEKIAVNFLDELGSAVIYELPRLRPDGISHTDFNLLMSALGDTYAERVVSSEYLVLDYFARPVKSEFELYAQIRADIDQRVRGALDSIEPGVTRVADVDAEFSVTDKNGRRQGGDHVIQGGDFLKFADGHQSGGYMDGEWWKYGNFHEVVDMYAYVLAEGETEPRAHLQRAWADALAVRKILEDNVKAGRTAAETFEILKREIRDAGFVYVDMQDIDRTSAPDKTFVPIDLHAAGPGIYAPRIGPLGPDWQRNIVLPMYHHFYLEYWVDVAIPEWGAGESLNMRFHDGAMATEEGVEYFFPPPTEILLVR